MRNIIAFVFMGLMIMSCGSTQEVEVQKPVVNETITKRDKPQKKSNFMEPELMAAKLGLSEERTEKFVTMWKTTGAAMKKVRREHKGDRAMLREKMMLVKYERDEGMKNILTPSEIEELHAMMKKHGGGTKAKRRGVNGN